jgi:uroporphyrinogen-III synthase
MSQLLQGLQVLVTRPAAQADHLCSLLEQAGADSHVLPVMDIHAHESTEAQARLKHVAAWDMLIFVSRNAVDFALPWLDRSSLPKVVAIGRKTAEFLREQGIRVDIVPAEFNSESLLALPVMQRVAGMRILIVRGYAGREKLAEKLSERGASVDYAEVYRRTKSAHNATRLQSLLAEQKIDALTVASGDALQNLVELAGMQKSELLSLPLFVISKRVAKLAHEAGFADTEHIHVASEASDEGLLQTITAWRQSEGTADD